MPYIPYKDRHDAKSGPIGCGQLNYAITILIKEYIEGHGVSYATFNDCLGALEGAKMELYRRKIAPYEDIKIQQNGDV